MLVKNILYLWAVFEYNVCIAKHEIKPEAAIRPALERDLAGVHG
ncbi:hypothetical protein [Paenibacillus sp. FSL W7-1332]